MFRARPGGVLPASIEWAKRIADRGCMNRITKRPKRSDLVSKSGVTVSDVIRNVAYSRHKCFLTCGTFLPASPREVLVRGARSERGHPHISEVAERFFCHARLKLGLGWRIWNGDGLGEGPAFSRSASYF